MLKEPRVGGTWEWHQDFGYWYQVGALEPDKMLSAVLAVDDHTRENGCMQLLRGSHRLGRLAHGLAGEQAGADAAMVRAARARFELVHAEMRAGDILFTHSNLLHASAPNDSPSWRRSLIVAYNAVDNPPREGTVCPLPADAPIAPLFEDSEIRERGVVHIAGADVADFLDQFDASTQKAERERAAQRERSARAELRKPCSWWRTWSILLEDSAPAASGLVLVYALPSAVSAAHISSPYPPGGACPRPAFCSRARRRRQRRKKFGCAASAAMSPCTAPRAST